MRRASGQRTARTVYVDPIEWGKYMVHCKNAYGQSTSARIRQHMMDDMAGESSEPGKGKRINLEAVERELESAIEESQSIKQKLRKDGQANEVDLLLVFNDLADELGLAKNLSNAEEIMNKLMGYEPTPEDSFNKDHLFQFRRLLKVAKRKQELNAILVAEEKARAKDVETKSSSLAH